MLKLSDHIKLENFIYAHNSLRSNLPVPLRASLQLSANSHNLNTRCVTTQKMVLPKVRTPYGLNSLIYQATAAWNYFVNALPKLSLTSVSKAICKKNITQYLIDRYV